MKHLFNFIIYSVFGFLYETIIKLIFSYNYDSGVLYGPYTLIYGVSITLSFYFFDKLKKENIVFKFLISSFICTIFELIFGCFIEFVFNKVYWSYNSFYTHIGTYISIITSIFWGISIVLLDKFIKSKINNLYLRTNKKIIIISFIIILIDILFTFIFKSKF